MAGVFLWLRRGPSAGQTIHRTLLLSHQVSGKAAVGDTRKQSSKQSGHRKQPGFYGHCLPAIG